ncbi:MAG: hypothetical protein WD768_01195 [Phycisphaeraceae bacterium]
MRIGLDLDNTIICYDRLFHRLAIERGLIPRELPATKAAVRDHLRSIGREDEWTAMQGEAYGSRIDEAEIFPGVIDFLVDAHVAGHSINIISHKTRRPFRGPEVDLHACAMRLLRHRGFFEGMRTGLTENRVWFEPTKQDKLARIATLACDWFVDDLPEFLLEPAFPRGVRQILFDPANLAGGDERYIRVQAWNSLSDIIQEEAVRA